MVLKCNSGNSKNGLVTCNLKANETILIRIQVANEKRGGSFSFYFHRGFPVSTYEKNEMFSEFNRDLCKDNNCYTYAMGYPFNPLTRKTFLFCGPGCLQDGGDGIDLEWFTKFFLDTTVYAEFRFVAKYIHKKILKEVKKDLESCSGDIQEIDKK
jgi:hypothetical protein